MLRSRHYFLEPLLLVRSRTYKLPRTIEAVPKRDCPLLVPYSHGPQLSRNVCQILVYMTSNSMADLLAARSFPSLLSILRSLSTNRLEACRAPNNTNDESITSETLQFLAAGKSGVVYVVDPRRVLKEYHDSDGAEVEHRAYRMVRALKSFCTAAPSY